MLAPKINQGKCVGPLWIRHETKQQIPWKRYDKGHRKAEIFNAFFALLFIVKVRSQAHQGSWASW